MAINEGSYVYVRAIATKHVRFYDNGVEVEQSGITVTPINREGERFDYINVPASSVVSAQAAKWAIQRKIESESGSLD